MEVPEFKVSNNCMKLEMTAESLRVSQTSQDTFMDIFSFEPYNDLSYESHGKPKLREAE